MAYEDGKNAIAEVGYSHDAMIDVLVARPMATQREIARHFGYTESWVSQVFASDSFKKRFAERRDALVDPMITKSLEHLFEGVGRLSLSIVQEKLETTRDAEYALKALEVTRKGLGLGNKDTRPLVQNFVAVVPQKAATYEDWMVNHSPRPPGVAEQRGVVIEQASAEKIQTEMHTVDTLWPDNGDTQ